MTITEIKAVNAAHGYHFFDPDTLRFFGSRVSSQTFGRIFITSEVAMRGGDRRYTVRRLLDTGRIQTIGEFRQYATLGAAISAAQEVTA